MSIKQEDSPLKNKEKLKYPLRKNPLLGLNINKLSNMRIIQKYLVYVIGLSSSIANKEVKILIKFLIKI
jgi:hypothetical protein